MDRIRIVGGERLNGIIPISGAKNAALPLMIASLLTRETLTLTNVPRLADVNMLARILGNHGVDVTIAGKKAGQRTTDGQTFRLTAPDIVDTTAPYEMVARMRASFWVLAPLVARCGNAKVSLPGGCAIGPRPVDLHLTTLEALGAEIELEGGYVIARAPRGLTGNKINALKGLGRRHAQRLDGGGARPRRDANRECRARTRGGRCRQLPDQDGRADRRRRQPDAVDPGTRDPAWR